MVTGFARDCELFHPPRHCCHPVTIDIADAFNDPRIYANPCCFPLVKQILGGQAVLDSFGVVCAFPGAPAQHFTSIIRPSFQRARWT